ncbi:MAG: hypothetical protein M3P52_12145 [Actinomycetota bacterium]|nr:hypothetical protein [Actinomycetota bacterium]
MPRSPTRPRLPLASDPIRSSIDALAVVSLAIHRPLEAETIAFFLDEGGRSNTITVVSGTTEPDSVLSVAECMAVAGGRSPALCGVVLATVRPNTAPDLPCNLPGDIDRWLEANAITESHGIELIEWFIVGPSGVECPRELLGEPDRW